MNDVLVIACVEEQYHAFVTDRDMVGDCGEVLDNSTLDNECCLDNMPNDSCYVFELRPKVRKLVWTNDQQKHLALTALGRFKIENAAGSWSLYFRQDGCRKYELVTYSSKKEDMLKLAQRFFEQLCHKLISELYE